MKNKPAERGGIDLAVKVEEKMLLAFLENDRLKHPDQRCTEGLEISPKAPL